MKYIDTRIPIIFATDNNYALITAVAIHSLCKQMCQTKELLIVILTDGMLNEDKKNYFRILENKYGIHCEIKIENINVHIFDKVTCNMGYYPKTILYRLLLPSILSDYNKCIYLDSDILVLDNIFELMNIDITGSYLAGVKDDWLYRNRPQYFEQIQYDERFVYVNSGVLIMNLLELRKDNKEKEFLEMAISDNKYSMLDQDILNVSCREKLKLLDKKYNYIITNGISDQPVSIVHFAGGTGTKPWLNQHNKYYKIWRQYVEIFLPSETWECYKKQAFDKINFWSKIKSLSNGKIYVWGYGESGKILLDDLLRNRIKVEAFIDNDKNKRGLKYKETVVISPDMLQLEVGSVVVNSVNATRESVTMQILEMGISKEQILQYYSKDRQYYATLDEQYLKEELKELIEKKI